VLDFNKKTRKISRQSHGFRHLKKQRCTDLF
jgi:hypothetical protein